ncbi:hypothetical protein QBA74_42495 [Streptomyces scabiei]
MEVEVVGEFLDCVTERLCRAPQTGTRRRVFDDHAVVTDVAVVLAVRPGR